MVIFWFGFFMKLLVVDVELILKVKYVCFIFFYDIEIIKGFGFWVIGYFWFYMEGLRIDEMINELVFFVMGMYGKLLFK